MISFTLSRFVQALTSILIASILIFLIAEALPGDVAQMILGQFATEDSLAALRNKLELNKPLHTRYINWLSGVFRGDLGTSLSKTGVEVGPLLLRRARNSLVLAAGSMIFIIPVSFLLGIAAGLKPGSWLDRLISITTLGLISFPSFITGLVLILIFSVQLGWLPASSSLDLSVGIFQQLPKLILPILALSGVMLGYITRHIRASMVKVLRSDYTRAATLKGLGRRTVITKHVLRNALLPAITVIAINLGWLLGGAVVVEATFGYPGVARLVLNAIKHRDIPVMEAGLLFVVIAYITVNFGTDVLYTLLDPRIRYSRGEE
ncbi:ABC transporter permease [Candidatus Bipolaricaulota bacterium]|nr:ABC transporter permease [Candidatus Bipolaricaulota bacterium]MBS3814265.1 ABC transporter permease [Candidatus Bipolaricaulota bacterium]MBS3825291.1 ABC transporter permease [Candidatus Bipolaricaulota bacterium]